MLAIPKQKARPHFIPYFLLICVWLWSFNLTARWRYRWSTWAQPVFYERWHSVFIYFHCSCFFPPFVCSLKMKLLHAQYQGRICVCFPALFKISNKFGPYDYCGHFVLTINTQFFHWRAMHCESWTCAYVRNVFFRHSCSPVQLNVWALFFLVIHWPPNSACSVRRNSIAASMWTSPSMTAGSFRRLWSLKCGGSPVVSIDCGCGFKS